MKLFLYICAVLCYTVSLGQGQKTYLVKPNAKILDVIPLEEIYLYPEFIQGTVTFRNNSASNGRLNYNILLNEVQFIDKRGDTLSLAEEVTVRYVAVMKDTFYYSKGYVKQLDGNVSVKLAEREFFKEFVQKPSAYDMSSGATAVNTISAIIVDRAYNLDIAQEVVLVKSKAFFLGNKYNDFALANRKNIFRIFPDQKKEITKFLDSERIDFGKKQDMEKLLIFLEGLPMR